MPLWHACQDGVVLIKTALIQLGDSIHHGWERVISAPHPAPTPLTQPNTNTTTRNRRSLPPRHKFTVSRQYTITHQSVCVRARKRVSVCVSVRVCVCVCVSASVCVWMFGCVSTRHQTPTSSCGGNRRWKQVAGGWWMIAGSMAAGSMIAGSMAAG